MSRFTGDLMDRTIFEGDYDDDREGQARIPDEGAPEAPLPEAETERRRTLTDAELLAELELHAEYGQ